MFVEMLEFLCDNKKILVGATVTICEIAVVIINAYKLAKANKSRRVHIMTYDSKWTRFLWVINPLNVFKALY